MNLRQGIFLTGLILLGLCGLMLGENEITQQDVEEMFFVSSPTGYENQMSEKIIQLLPDKKAVTRDSLGSVYVFKEGDLSHVSVICGMDEIGYIVGGIDSQGYITLDRVVSAPYPLFDSFFPGHVMRIWTDKGSILGVLAVPSLHIFPREERENFLDYFSLEKMRLDIGASSRKQAREQGILNCAPVTYEKKMGHLAEGKIAGYSMGRKACAALVLNLAEKVFREENLGRVTLGWLAQTRMAARGFRPRASMGGVRAEKYLTSQENIILDVFPVEWLEDKEISLGKGPVLIPVGEGESPWIRWIQENAEKHQIPVQKAQSLENMILNAFSGSEKNSIGIFLPVKFADSPSETIDLNDLQALEKLVVLFLSERGSR